MKKILNLLILTIPFLLFAQGTPRAGGINNGIAPTLNTVHNNFVGVQHSNSNSFAVYDFTTTFNYQLGLNTTDNLAEGTSNKYFSNTLARNAFSAGTGLVYSAGIFGLDSGTLGILSSVSNKFDIPTGTTSQYVSGDGSLITFPTIPTLISQLTNDSGYITSVPAQSFGSLTGKPTTLTGYGITDAYPLTGNPSNFLTTINSLQVTTALGFVPYNSTNPNGYISSVPAQTWTSITGKPTFSNVATSGDYNDLTNKPVIYSFTGTSNQYTKGDGTYGTLTATKRQETYSGTTNASGNYTITFGTAFSTAPNIQASITNQGVNTNQFIKVVSVSTTGFTINVFQRSAVTLLGIEVLLAATTNVPSIPVDVLVTEK